VSTKAEEKHLVNSKQTSGFKNYLKGKNREELYESFSEALEAVRERSVPDWDR